MLNQPCMRCNKNQAIVKITKINKGTYLELALCQECAARESSVQKKMINKGNLQSLLSNLLKNKLEQGAKIEGESKASDLVCPSCGHTLSKYVESALLGCPDCYAAFEERLIRDIRKFHGNTSHTGKKPVHYSPMEPAWARIKSLASKNDVEETKIPKSESITNVPDEFGMIDEVEAIDEEVSAEMSVFDQIENLMRKLKTATDEEDFQRAAQLRDEIKELESQISGDDSE